MTNIPKIEVDPANEELLERYFTLPEKQREQEFPTTERAAAITGMSRRTIQHWVETGAVNAIFVGRKCRINFASLLTYMKRRVDGEKHC